MAYMLPPASVPPLGATDSFQLFLHGERSHAIPRLSAMFKPRRKSPFGNHLSDYAMAECYGEEAPQVLVALWCALVRSGGLLVEGIFRLAPDAAECMAVERRLCQGRLAQGKDGPSPIVLAHLIKKFLRELPGGLLGTVQSDVLSDCCEHSADHPTTIAGLWRQLEPQAASTLRWLVRIICIVQQCRDKNQMSLKNIALVFAPNMSGPPTAGGALNPFEELKRVEHATTILHRMVIALDHSGAGAPNGL